MSKKSLERGAGNNRRIESLPVRTQFLIFTLFGDYVLEKSGKIWTSSLLYLMSLLDVSERAVRSTLSRMTKKGWIIPERHGRRSQYSLSDQGRTLLERGQRRIFEPTFTRWDKRWQIITYSLPSTYRPIRHTLRTQLSWLGFGSLAPGTWISPHNRAEELESLIEDLDIGPFVDMFSGTYLGPSVSTELAQRCWDLPAIEGQYQKFVNRYQKEYQKLYNKGNGAPLLPREECFIRRFWLTHMFQSFPLKDPNLPPELLPPDWIGTTSRKLFDNYHKFLGNYANQFVDEVISGVNVKEADQEPIRI